jgi:N-acetylmuramoyl-L-alanine amidase
MKIVNQRLVHDDDSPCRFQMSPNTNIGTLQPEYLVIHYTEGQTLEGAVIWLTSPNSGVSSHLVIGRDGTVVQLVPFDRIARHAGESQWNGRVRLNRYSIGIELDNAGLLVRTRNGWKSAFGRIYPDEDVIEATHKFGTRRYGWHKFTPEQIAACREVAVALVRQYGLLDIVGHDDIAPRRKWDPGPAFPIDEFRADVMAQATVQPSPAPASPVIVPDQPPVPVNIGGGVPAPVPPASPDPSLALRVPVIEYHDSEFSMGPKVRMRTDWFLAQLKWLSDNGFHSLTGAELIRFVRGEAQPPKKSFALRFDLGAPVYSNVRDVIVPALQQYGFHAIFFALTSSLREDNRNNCISWSNLLEWEATGLVEIGSHGVNHPDYQKLTIAGQRWDARESRKLLEVKLNHPISFFAFPKDSVPTRPDLVLKPLGYDLAFDGARIERSVTFKDKNPYGLPCYYPYADPKKYPAINGMKGLDFGGMMLAASA